jgi:hypothetical protein
MPFWCGDWGVSSSRSMVGSVVQSGDVGGGIERRVYAVE